MKVSQFKVGQKYRLEGGQLGTIMSVKASSPNYYIGYIDFKEFLSRYTRVELEVIYEEGDKIHRRTAYENSN